jgi:hypothetical protein
MPAIADIKVQDKAELYEKLDAAAAAAHTNALTNRRSGVLSTRHEFDHFSASLSPSVPSGITQENDQARRN